MRLHLPARGPCGSGGESGSFSWWKHSGLQWIAVDCPRRELLTLFCMHVSSSRTLWKPKHLSRFRYVNMQALQYCKHGESVRVCSWPALATLTNYPHRTYAWSQHEKLDPHKIAEMTAISVNSKPYSDESDGLFPAPHWKCVLVRKIWGLDPAESLCRMSATKIQRIRWIRRAACIVADRTNHSADWIKRSCYVRHRASGEW